MFLFRVVLIAIFIATLPAYAEQTITGKTTVTDGDTIKIGKERIRLIGIDSPEKHQKCCLPNAEEWRCGIAATKFLKGIIQNREVSCTYKKRDRYKRILGTCWIGNLDLNETMVENGFAVVYRYLDKKRGYIAPDKKYVANEETAKANKHGIWSSKFIPPGRWRKGDRLYCH